ncbi:META domain-containing protein [Chloroflexota bacterium]
MELTLPGPIGSTMMACPELIMEQELEYLRALESSESYETEGDMLRINYGGKVLIFRRK